MYMHAQADWPGTQQGTNRMVIGLVLPAAEQSVRKNKSTE